MINERPIYKCSYPDVFLDDAFSYEDEDDPIRAALADGIAGWSFRQAKLFMSDENFRKGLVKIGRVLEIYPSDAMLTQYAIKMMEREKNPEANIDESYGHYADVKMYYLAEEYLELAKRIFKDD